MKLFEDTVNPETGEHSLTENIKPRIIQSYCSSGEHYWICEDSKTRELVCKKCGLGSMWNIGFYDLKDGKLIRR